MKNDRIPDGRKNSVLGRVLLKTFFLSLLITTPELNLNGARTDAELRGRRPFLESLWNMIEHS